MHQVMDHCGYGCKIKKNKIMPQEFKAPLGVKVLLGAVVVALILHNVFMLHTKKIRIIKSFQKRDFFKSYKFSSMKVGRLNFILKMD